MSTYSADMALIVCQSAKRCCLPLLLQKFLIYILCVQLVSQLVDIVIKVDHIWVGYFPMVLTSHSWLVNHPKLLALLNRNNLVASAKIGQSSRVIRVVIHSTPHVTLRMASSSTICEWIEIRAIRCRHAICNSCHFSLFTPYMVWVVIKVMLLIQENPLNDLPRRRHWRCSASWVISACSVPWFSARWAVWIRLFAIIIFLLSFISLRLAKAMKWILFWPRWSVVVCSVEVIFDSFRLV